MNKFLPVDKQLQSPSSRDRLTYLQLKKQLQTQEHQLKEIGQVYDDLLKEHQEVLKSHVHLEEEVKMLKTDQVLSQTMNLENQRLHQQVEDLQKEKTAVEAQRNCLMKVNIKLEEELDGLYKELVDVIDRATTSEEREMKLKEELRVKKEEIQNLSRVIESLEHLGKQHEAQEEELIYMKDALERAEADARTEYECLKLEHEDALRSIRDSQEMTMTRMMTTIEEKDREIRNLITEKDKALKRAEASDQDSGEEIAVLKDRFEREIRLLRSQLDEKTRECQELKNRVDSCMSHCVHDSGENVKCKDNLNVQDGLDEIHFKGEVTFGELPKRISEDENKDHLNNYLINQKTISKCNTNIIGNPFGDNLKKPKNSGVANVPNSGSTPTFRDGTNGRLIGTKELVPEGSWETFEQEVPRPAPRIWSFLSKLRNKDRHVQCSRL